MITVATAAAALAVLAAPARAPAAEVTRVVSALDDENRFDFNVTLAWLHEAKSGFIKRESESSAGSQLLKELKFGQTRDVLDLRIDIGLLPNLGLQVDAPLVLRDARSLDFDRSAGDGCIYPGMAGTPSCVNGENSTFLGDRIVPFPNPNTWGLDAEHGGRPFTKDPNNPDPLYQGPAGVFRGPIRRGFQDLGVGLNWAVFNQARDDTKPTWLLGFEARLDLFKDMRFDPANPTANTAVGPGYHQLIAKTSVSKRIRRFEPYFAAWYSYPIRTEGSIYQSYPGDNQGAVNPQQRALVMFGFEQTMWQNPRGDQRVIFEARGRAEERFFGRSATELWEPLSGHPGCTLDAAGATPTTSSCRAGLDVVTDAAGNPQAAPHPGVTETQAYGTFGGDAGVSVLVGRYVRFRGLFGLTYDMPHFITFSNAGVDRNADGRVDSTSVNEANPTYREIIDLPGRRFKVEGASMWSLLIEGSILF